MVPRVRAEERMESVVLMGEEARGEAPTSWFVTDHVNHGRRHLNFSRWGGYDRRRADDLLKEICTTAKAGVMPLDSYTLVRRSARLAPADVRALCEWAGGEQRRLAAAD